MVSKTGCAVLAGVGLVLASLVTAPLPQWKYRDWLAAAVRNATVDELVAVADDAHHRVSWDGDHVAEESRKLCLARVAPLRPADPAAVCAVPEGLSLAKAAQFYVVVLHMINRAVLQDLYVRVPEHASVALAAERGIRASQAKHPKERAAALANVHALELQKTRRGQSRCWLRELKEAFNTEAVGAAAGAAGFLKSVWAFLGRALRVLASKPSPSVPVKSCQPHRRTQPRQDAPEPHARGLIARVLALPLRLVEAFFTLVAGVLVWCGAVASLAAAGPKAAKFVARLVLRAMWRSLCAVLAAAASRSAPRQPPPQPQPSSLQHRHECPICYNEKEQSQFGKLPCSHVLCRGCAAEWLLHDHGCPFCRAPVPGGVNALGPA